MKILKEESVKERSLQITPIAEHPKQLATFRRIPGVKWWQLCLDDKEKAKVEEVIFDNTIAGYKAGVSNRVDAKNNTLYVPAINKSVAERKFSKMVKELLK